MRKLYLTFISTMTSFLADAQERVSPDRPDQTETVYTVPKNYFQAEAGLAKQNSKDENYKIFHPTALLKYGISNKMELRLETNFATEYEHLIPDPKTSHNVEPVELGTKISLWEEKGLLPKTSFIGHVGLPFLASEKFHNDPLNFICRLTMQHTITEGIALSYNLGVKCGGNEATSFFYTIAPGFEIGKRWYAYAEAFGSFYSNTSEHNIDAGVGFFVTKDIMVDTSAGFGINNSELKNFISVGCSFRIPLKRKATE